MKMLNAGFKVWSANLYVETYAWHITYIVLGIFMIYYILV